MSYDLDSRIIGSLISGDIDGLDGIDGDIDGIDGDMDAIVGELIGRLRRTRPRAAKRLAAVHAAQGPTAAAANLAAMGKAATVGQNLMPSSQRVDYLPFDSTPTLLAAANSTATLNVDVQRAIQPKRVVLVAIDQTTFADVIRTITATSMLMGVRPAFNAQGFAPAVTWAHDAYDTWMNTDPLKSGQNATVVLNRMVATVNPSSVAGVIIGPSAQ